MDIAGSMAATSIRPPPISCTMTLHGSIVPILSSAVSAWCASGGLHAPSIRSVSYTHLRAHETRHDLVCRLLLRSTPLYSSAASDVYKRQTLHGSIVPILSSAVSAWCASGGLHAPSIR